MTKPVTVTTERRRREIVDKWRSSGLSQAEFCRKEGIKESALSYWKIRSQRSKERQLQSGRRTRARQKTVEKSGAEPGSSAFVSIISPLPSASNNLAASSSSGAPVAEIIVAGSTLRVFPGIDVDTIRALLLVLNECSI